MMKKAILIVVALAIVAGGAVYPFNTPEPEPQKHQKAEIVKDPLVTPEVYAIPATFDTIQVTPAKAEAEVKPEVKPAPKPEPKPVAVKPAPVVKPVEQPVAFRSNYKANGYTLPKDDGELYLTGGDAAEIGAGAPEMAMTVNMAKHFEAQSETVRDAVASKYGPSVAAQVVTYMKEGEQKIHGTPDNPGQAIVRVVQAGKDKIVVRTYRRDPILQVMEFKNGNIPSGVLKL